MNLYKTTFWNGIATVFKILTGLVTTKIVAVYLGTTGLALYGNFMNIAGIFTAFSNGGISTGVVKYVAEYVNEPQKQETVVAHAFKISIVCSLIIGVIVLIFHHQITILTVKDLKYDYATIILGFTMIFYSLNATITSLLNGYRQIKYLIINSMLSSFIMMILAIIITIRYGLYGALTNAMIAQCIIFFINLYLIKRLNLFNNKIKHIKKIEYETLHKLLKFGLMAIVSAIVGPLSIFIIRDYILMHLSITEAGYIQGLWTVSNAYLSIITTTLAVYYLPTLSAIKDSNELKKELIQGYKFILPLAIFGGVAIYMLKDVVILILFTPEFSPMRDLFLFQVIGDTIKIATWLISYLLLAKAMTRWFIISELIFNSTRVILSILFINMVGVIGATYGYVINYILYFIFLIILFREILFISPIKV